MPPPIPASARAPESIWLTYIRAAAIFLPGLFFLAFVTIFIFPKVEALWLEAGLQASHAQSFMRATQTLFSSARYLIIVLLTIFCLLECLWAPWPRWRAMVTTIAVSAFNIFVLLTLTTATISVCLTVPKLIRGAKVIPAQAPLSPPPKSQNP